MARHGHRRLGRPDQGQVQRLRQRRLPEAGRADQAIDREISKTAYIPAEGVNRTSGYSYPGNIIIPGVIGTRNPTNPTCAPPFSYPTTGSSATQCRYDFASQIETIPETEKLNIVGRATWQITPEHEAFLEGGYFNGKYTYRISPTPMSDRLVRRHLEFLTSSSRTTRRRSSLGRRQPDLPSTSCGG